MGIDRETYVGPYVQCFYKEGEKAPDTFDVQEAIGERLHLALGDSIWEAMQKEHCHIYLPNRGLESALSILESDDAFYQQMSSVDIQESVKEFLARYGPAVEKLQEIYGDCLVAYGVVHYVY